MFLLGLYLANIDCRHFASRSEEYLYGMRLSETPGGNNRGHGRPPRPVPTTKPRFIQPHLYGIFGLVSLTSLVVDVLYMSILSLLCDGSVDATKQRHT
jgi:hypothetical protein